LAISINFKPDLPLLHFTFLYAEDIGVRFSEEIQKALFQTGPDAPYFIWGWREDQKTR
jgi:hypothetical protein